jgi:DinB superfamily
MNALDVLKYGDQTVQRTLADFPEGEWDTAGVCGVLSVKEIVAHLAAYENILVDVLTTFVSKEPTPHLTKMLEQPDRFNEDEVTARKNKAPQEILDEYNHAHARAMELAARVSPETYRQPGTLPWYGAEYALDDLIAYQYYGHKQEHCAQIAVFLDRLKVA